MTRRDGCGCSLSAHGKYVKPNEGGARINRMTTRGQMVVGIQLIL